MTRCRTRPKDRAAARYTRAPSRAFPPAAEPVSTPPATPLLAREFRAAVLMLLPPRRRRSPPLPFSPDAAPLSGILPCQSRSRAAYKSAAAR